MSEEEKVKMVCDAAVDRNGRLVLACRAAFELAQSRGIAIAEIGAICQKHRIKIAACQLGCFQ
ncbi:MAG: hypothetical protein JW795_22660 [Chitinivibrionales bacterium]|nr:hypothetical protein [Chitinivibrionales bacterium]